MIIRSKSIETVLLSMESVNDINTWHTIGRTVVKYIIHKKKNIKGYTPGHIMCKVDILERMQTLYINLIFKTNVKISFKYEGSYYSSFT